ncbi:RNI-like protein [Ascobolus immersus RN42]|uniref:RNI-like protein n=1 Tax=Ascobolus immersus RN42 TaxID=1160509 RepID=A0A3N4IG46_ASCIM|nr:RNI-like protein [Ascobolus immersus RN42]
MMEANRTDNGHRERRNSTDVTNAGHHHSPTYVHAHPTAATSTPARRPSVGERQHSRENIAPASTNPLISALAATGGHSTPAPPVQPSSNNAPAPPRRSGSWLSNLSSKISAATHLTSHNNNTPSPSPASPHPTSHADSHPHPPSPHTEKPPNSPGFFIQTLRRLSTPGSASRPAKPVPVVQCERMVLNKNHTRERCKLPDLDASKLRKVAFSLDVQVAPNSLDEEERKRDAKKTEQERQERKERRERREQRRRSKDAEATLKEVIVSGLDAPVPEAVATPDVEKVLEVVEKTVTNGVVDAVPTTKDLAVNEVKIEPAIEVDDSAKEMAVAAVNGDDDVPPAVPEKDYPPNTVPKAKLPTPTGTPKSSKEDVSRTSRESSDAKDTKDEAPKEETYRNRPVHRKRTKNPALIYKRCCELRESSILDSILGKLSEYNADGSIETLDLTKIEITVSDAPAFSDFLTLVPIRKLILENCKLTDEAVRVILAGLLAVKRPSSERSSKSSDIRKQATGTEKTKPQRNDCYGGFVESLVLSDNPKLTKQGWNYVSLFVHMCHSLKALDMSKIPIPKVFNVKAPTTTKAQSVSGDIAGLFSMALCERLCKRGLEELNLNNCELSMEQVLRIMQGVVKSGIIRLGLAGSKLGLEGLEAVSRWMKTTEGCMALDLSGIDLRDHLDMIASSIRPNSSFLCLVLSNCNLNAQSLTALLPTLARLPNFRLLDLSQNLNLFASQPDALSVLRRYLPKLPVLKKLMLDGTSMDADHAIALFEIIPDVRQLSHLSMLQNPLYATDRSGPATPSYQSEAREENAALFTALVAMAKCSRTLVRVDVDKPPKGDELVLRALAKRMLSYLLRNMEKGACDDWMADTVDSTPYASDGGDDDDEDGADGDPDDEDYVIGGTGVVKALGVCLTNTPNRNYTTSPFDPTQLESARAHEMSKALLSRARSIKARVEGALTKSTTRDEMGKRKLLFLDDTLKKVIAKFEQEYPECRLPPPSPTPSLTEPDLVPESIEYDDALDIDPDSDSLEDRDAYGPTIKPSLSRRGSDISLASKKKVNEEAQMLKLGKLLIQGEEAGCISCEEGEGVADDVVRCPELGRHEVEGVAECVARKLEAEQKRREEVERFGLNGVKKEDRVDYGAGANEKAPVQLNTLVNAQSNGVNGGGVTWTHGYLEPVVESKKPEPEEGVHKVNGVVRQSRKE